MVRSSSQSIGNSIRGVDAFTELPLNGVEVHPHSPCGGQDRRLSESSTPRPRIRSLAASRGERGHLG